MRSASMNNAPCFIFIIGITESLIAPKGKKDHSFGLVLFKNTTLSTIVFSARSQLQ